MPRTTNIDLGSVWGRWTVLSPAPSTANYDRRFNCRCECGATRAVKLRYLRSGESKSCGCLKNDKLTARITTHNMTRSPTHYSWLNMISRCRHRSCREWANYGGRGITVCPQWDGVGGFEVFLHDMGVRPLGLTLDRIDSNGNYEPANCRWATPTQQAQNQRRSRSVTYLGETMNLADWSRRTGIPHSKLHARLYDMRWPVDEALGFTPHRHRRW